MLFRDLPVVYLSYKEDNAEANYAHLKGMLMGPNVMHVQGVKGFDAAHREAARRARTYAIGAGMDITYHPYFVTVDGDNQTDPSFWELDTDVMDRHIYHRDNRPSQTRSVLSWNAYNPLTGLAYGNGGLKLWGYQFVDQMQTHEHAAEDTVDFCWNTGYTQMAAIFSTTLTNGSAKQAFTAGFREGVKMPLTGGKMDFEALHETKFRSYPSNLERLICWCSLGAHETYGEWSMAGALSGFIKCHIEGKFKLADVSDIDKIHEQFEQWTALSTKLGPQTVAQHMTGMRREIELKTDMPIPAFGAKQSRFVVEHSRPTLGQHPFQLETWPPRLELKR